ncbi:MAG: T9SS type A sorting domain-containing protein, partial [Bacteroidota bacterium]|nr:T9SS type A sorting domain-containing protein [Bacteroidota bacterium]
GSNNILGNIGLNLSIMRTFGPTAVSPVKGVGVVIKKNPGSSAERVLVTNNNGDFNTGNLNDGSYRVFVDIPGLHMTGTYDFTVSNGAVVSGLDFTVGTDSIHPNNQSVIGIKENSKSSSTEFMSAYPNPYSSAATIVVNNTQSQNVLLEVYNMLGEKVQTLENSHKQIGTYKYSFSAKNLNQSTGMYFVKLTVGNKTNVIKIVEQ